MKYLILQKQGLEFAILFPEAIQHREAVDLYADPRAIKLVSAGFCKIGHGHGHDLSGLIPVSEIRVWGRSDSLSLESRPQDAAVIHFSLSLPTMTPSELESHPCSSVLIRG